MKKKITSLTGQDDNENAKGLENSWTPTPKHAKNPNGQKIPKKEEDGKKLDDDSRTHLSGDLARDLNGKSGSNELMLEINATEIDGEINF